MYLREVIPEEVGPLIFPRWSDDRSANWAMSWRTGDDLRARAGCVGMCGGESGGLVGWRGTGGVCCGRVGGGGITHLSEHPFCNTGRVSSCPCLLCRLGHREESSSTDLQALVA